MTKPDTALTDEEIKSVWDSLREIPELNDITQEGWLLKKQVAFARNAEQLVLAKQAQRQEQVKFLANGTRFKMPFFKDGGVRCFFGHEKELDGRWVALVAAEDDCHLSYTTQPTYTALLEAAEKLCTEIDRHQISAPISATDLHWYKKELHAAIEAYKK